MASQGNFTQISSVPEIIIHIYKFLDFEDQLRLSRVDSQLKLMFKSFIWREEYSSLKVHKNPPYFVVNNEKCENRLCLNSTEYQEFLRSYADEVLEFTLHHPKTYGKSIDTDVYLNYFQNLLSFKYEQDTIPLADVKVIAERNANLQELKLKGYYNEYVTDELIECILPKMLNLKRLHIEPISEFNIKLSKFQTFLSETQLETLNLTTEIMWGKSLQESKNANTRANRLKVFNLHTTFDRHKWPSNCESYFRNLKSLKALTITIVRSVTDEILATIVENCNCLETLRFELTPFYDIKLFLVPSSVVEFSLVRCYGLTYENLKQILNQNNITKFYSSYTEYQGEFEDFPISPLIEILHIKNAFDTLQHESSYKAINNLKELVWYHSCPKVYITPSCSLKHCINLHTLIMVDCQIDVAALLELKSLRKLAMPHLIPLFEWSFIIQLLEKHSSLRELVIENFSSKGCSTFSLPEPHRQISTDVRSIDIPYNILLLSLDFWMDLLSGNKSLKLIFHILDIHSRLGEVIRNIVNHRNFPKSMKTIDMTGFRTDCNFIRKHYDEYLKELKIQTENALDWDDCYKYRISLCRK